MLAVAGLMVTDPLPKNARVRKQFEASDAQPSLALPPALPLQAATAALGVALTLDDAKAVGAAGRQLLEVLATFYGTSVPKLKVLGMRPLKVIENTYSYELFGDYTLATEVIRVWMRTAVQGKVTSHRGLLNTLLHEYCHHLDVKALALPDTPHTRGFFARVDDLYHLALATPADRRRPLVWIKSRDVWRIDWRKLRAPAPAR
jgi:hypothetical protein